MFLRYFKAVMYFTPLFLSKPLTMFRGTRFEKHCSSSTFFAVSNTVVIISFTPSYIHTRLICMVHEGNEDNANMRVKAVNMLNAFIVFV
jgi:hypothetical protein